MTKEPAPMLYKPDLKEAAQRWEAFYNGDLIDRPLVYVTSPKSGLTPQDLEPYRITYYDRMFGDFDEMIDRAIGGAERTFFGGEAIPTFNTDFATDEISAFLGAELVFSPDSGNTTWSKPYVQDWESALPLRIREDNPIWQRMLAFYRRAAERLGGKMLINPLDLHTNMDILSAIRGPQQLCIDLLEVPELIDQAMADARTIFKQIWEAISDAGDMRKNGYCQLVYSMEGAAMLQCDFAYMIGPAMFNRWVMPALEEEMELTRHSFYHWDGPGALVHFDALVNSPRMHTLSYVPGDGVGASIARLDVLKRVQAAGKAVHAWGSVDELKQMHKELQPDKVCYTTSVESQAEAEALLDWFVKHT